MQKSESSCRGASARRRVKEYLSKLSLGKEMNKRKFNLSFFLITICIACVGLSSEIVYSQSHDKATVFKTQKKLQELGYNPGPLDGIWGKKTKSALKRFQHDNSLFMTGKLDSITKEKLSIISLKKSVPKQGIPVFSIQDSIREALERTWKIKKVQIENDILTVVSNFSSINKQGYASMILEICRCANVSTRLKEIWIFNASQNQGWVLMQAEKCNQAMHAPFNQVNNLIFRYSANFLMFEFR